jgi:hypothetical protein
MATSLSGLKLVLMRSVYYIFLFFTTAFLLKKIPTLSDGDSFSTLGLYLQQCASPVALFFALEPAPSLQR